MIRHMHILSIGALLGAVALTGCQNNPALADRFIENKGAQAFLERIATNCGDLSVGSQTLEYLLETHSENAYFIDETSKLYFGKTDKETYTRNIKLFYPVGDNKAATECIFEQLDK